MKQATTKLYYLLQETWRGWRRGGWMNWAAISTVTVLLFLFGLQLLVFWRLSGFLQQFGSQLEIFVYLKESSQPAIVQAAVAQIPQVQQVTVVSRDQAWQRLISQLGFSDVQSLTQQLEGNPLLDELKVQVSSAAAVLPVASQLAQLPEAEAVRYMDEAIARLTQVNQSLGWVGAGITILLTLTAIAVISTTIRLIFLARRREVEIMQLVGATRVWIYLPFMVQGMSFGLIGSAIALTMLNFCQTLLQQLLNKLPELWQLATLSREPTWLLTIILITFGVCLGGFGSLTAVQRSPRIFGDPSHSPAL